MASRLALTTLALLSVASVAGALEIPITVEEPLGVARTAEPVSGGIPMPWGQVKAGTPWALFDGATEIPLQATPMVVDENGFLRWVLIDFQVSLNAREKKTFTLKTLPPSAKPQTALSVTDAADAVTIETGKAKIVISRTSPFALLDSATADGKPVLTGGEVSYTEGFDGKRYTADKPASVVVEYNGPMRATVCVKGRFVGDDQNKFQYIARITAWAGRSDVHVKYSLANSNPDHYSFRQVKDSTIALRLAAAPQATVLGASKPLEIAGDAWMQQSARSLKVSIHKNDTFKWAKWYHGSTEPDACVAMAGDKKLWGSAAAKPLPNPPGAVQPTELSEGWLYTQRGDGGVFVTDLYFVEDPPRKLAVAKDTILLTGVTEPLEGAKLPFAQKTRVLFDCSHLSSQYVLDLAAPADNAALSSKAKVARGRLLAMAEPAWYFQSGQLPVGNFGTQADELKCYDTWGWKYEEKDIPRGPVDICSRIQRWTCGDDNHFTSEQDTVEALLLMYLRTGGRGFFDATESWVNYFMDLEMWRTDGWRWQDGGVWWHGGPIGNRPQRAADPVTGLRNGIAEGFGRMKTKIGEWGPNLCADMSFHFLAKSCHCHNWGEGLVEWYMITGDRDALEAAIDAVELNYDTQIRAFGKAPGKDVGFSRDFTRSCYLTNAARMVLPTDEFVVQASDKLAAAFLGRPVKEVRGFVNGPHPVRMSLKGANGIEGLVGPQGIAEMERLGVTWDEKAGQLTDPKTGAKWYPLVGVNTWMYPPLSRAMETYYRLTGNEDAPDWIIAYGQAVAHVMYQPRHGNQHGNILVDFPVRGVAKDYASWVLPESAKDGEGIAMSGYLGQFYPDVAARAYTFCGEPFLKQRAYDYWCYSSHRGYAATKLDNLGGVGWWVNCYTTHSESVSYTGRTFWEFSHPRADEKAPAALGDLAVTISGDKATLSFTAPADQGGKVARYQVKCSDKPIVDYETFLKKFAAHEDAAVTNFWMAANVAGEPKPGAAGMKESFTVTGVPAGAKHFVVVSFDDSSNRSALSNVAEVK